MPLPDVPQLLALGHLEGRCHGLGTDKNELALSLSAPKEKEGQSKAMEALGRRFAAAWKVAWGCPAQEGEAAFDHPLKATQG